MISALYVEDAVRDDERARRIMNRFSSVPVVPCDRYTTVFNPRSQNFRLQRSRPGLILARIFKNLVLETPPGYGIGGQHNFYFSHMLNCIYDCRYCLLRGMYGSANYVLFVNFDDFLSAMDEKLKACDGDTVWFFSGYDYDSLAFEPVSGFIENTLLFFADRSNAWLEIRTKSVQIRQLLTVDPLPNVVVASSLTPNALSGSLEHGVPSVEKRIQATSRLQRHGWSVGLRFDPLLYERNYPEHYQRLFHDVFARLDVDMVHSVTLGPFRMPRDYFRNTLRVYADEPLLVGPFDTQRGVVSYRGDLREELASSCTDQVLAFVPREVMFAA